MYEYLPSLLVVTFQLFPMSLYDFPPDIGHIYFYYNFILEFPPGVSLHFLRFYIAVSVVIEWIEKLPESVPSIAHGG